MSEYIYNIELADKQLEYLKERFNYEEQRQSILDNKLSQITGQAGIIFGIVGLFIPLFYGSLAQLPIFLKIVLTILLLISFISFIGSIICSAKSLNIGKFSYSTTSTNTVLKNHQSKQEFITEEINDLIYSIKHNLELNNKKGTYLNKAHFGFKTGIISIGILSIFLFFQKPDDQKIFIENQILIEKIEKSLDSIHNDLKAISYSIEESKRFKADSINK
jgi:hypothetical protein